MRLGHASSSALAALMQMAGMSYDTGADDTRQPAHAGPDEGQPHASGGANPSDPFAGVAQQESERMRFSDLDTESESESEPNEYPSGAADEDETLLLFRPAPLP